MMIDTLNPETGSHLPTYVMRRLRRNKSYITWTSIAMIAVGALAIFFPAISTFTLSMLVGWLLVFTGIVTFLGSFSIVAAGPFFGSLLLGLLKIAGGLVILYNPTIGILFMTILVSAVFMVNGAYQLAYAFELKPHSGWGWMLASSMVSILCGIYIAIALPMASIWLVGFLFGLTYLSTGIASMYFANHLPSPE